MFCSASAQREKNLASLLERRVERCRKAGGAEGAGGGAGGWGWFLG